MCRVDRKSVARDLLRYVLCSEGLWDTKIYVGAATTSPNAVSCWSGWESQQGGA